MGKLKTVITFTAVDRMFLCIVDVLLEEDRDSQKQWLTVVRGLQKKDGMIAFTSYINETEQKYQLLIIALMDQYYY
jgi:hypothetical protein